MSKSWRCLFAAIAIVSGGAAHAGSQPADRPPLRLVQTIELKTIPAEPGDLSSGDLAHEVQTSRMVNVKNHFDHFEMDLKRHRLFVTPEDYQRVEVYNQRTGKLIRTIGGIGRAHSILYRGDIDELFVTDGDLGSLKIFKGSNYKLVKDVKLLIDADAIGYDPSNQYLYIDNGGLDAGIKYCVLSIVDTNTGKRMGDIRIDSNRVEAMVLEKAGPRLFLNMVERSEVGVIDREKRALVATWPVTGGRINVGIALDEEHHRLFVACREGKLMVLDSDTGALLQTLPIATGVDDMVYDPVRKRIYVTCGEGFVDVYEQTDADHYRLLGAVATGPLGKTGRLVPEWNRFFVAVPPHGKTSAEVLVFEVQ